MNYAIRKLYWCENRGMMAAGMDGTNQTLLDNTIHRIFSLTVDTEGDRLFWVQEGAPMTIQSLSIEGSNKITVVQSVGGYGLDILGQNLYYYTKALNNTRYITKWNLSEPTSTYEIVSPAISSNDPWAMAAYAQEYKVDGMDNPCSRFNGGCEQICVPTPRGRRCACWDGFNVVNETKCFITVSSCPLEYTATYGRIQNPGYPGYRNNLRCQIIVPRRKPDQVIVLKVEHFDLEKDQDFLQIESIKWTGSFSSGYRYTVRTSEIPWRFITGASSSTKGFSIIYEIHNVTSFSNPSPCMHGGTSIDGQFCECPPSYTGVRCELINDDPCRSLPCQNGAECEFLSSDYRCRCRPGTTGRHCEIAQPCASVTCHNGGECKHTDLGMWCECQPGFTGHLCGTDINECDSSPCHNNATCEDSRNSYNCSCMPGYTGDICETKMDLCATNPCENNGTCTQAFDQYHCHCVAGYHGVHCEKDIDECASSPCRNGARCSTSQADMYTCDCLAGYTGYNCETDFDDECSSSPCRNGARCSTSQVDMYTCDCLAGYTGYNCETDTNTCRSDPCLNGGTCRDWFNGYHCQCVDGFSGNVCGKQSKDGSPIPIIAGFASGTLLLGLVIGIIVGMIICRCRRQQSDDEDAAVEMSGETNKQCHTEEEAMTTTDFKDAIVQDDDKSAEEFAAQQRAYSQQLHADAIPKRPAAPDPRHTYVNAAMITRQVVAGDGKLM